MIKVFRKDLSWKWLKQKMDFRDCVDFLWEKFRLSSAKSFNLWIPDNISTKNLDEDLETTFFLKTKYDVNQGARFIIWALKK